MKELHKHSNIDEALRLIALKQNNQSASKRIETEAEFVFATALEKEMSIPSKEALINKLNGVLQTETLGELIERVSDEQNLTVEVLSEVCSLSPTIVEGIKLDKLFPNSIPIHALKKLFQRMSISLDQWESAVRKTFSILLSESTTMDMNLPGVQPVFRKKSASESLHTGKSVLGSKESTLYKNEEALNKYISRLKELTEPE